MTEKPSSLSPSLELSVGTVAYRGRAARRSRGLASLCSSVDMSPLCLAASSFHGISRSWDHHDLLLVQPEYNGSSQCSTSARLISIAPYSDRKEIAVYATDLLTGSMVRCKVLIDKISRIKIFHHAVKINLDDLATLNITAFDDEENVFSSLVGLQFSWQLLPKSLEAESMHRLIHVPLKETPLGDCVSGFCEDLDVQLQLEDKGLGSNLYVVKGIGIGHEIVKAKLLEPQLEHLEDEITLTVAEAMSLDPPSPIFVTVGSLIYYSLRVIHGNTHQGFKGSK